MGRFTKVKKQVKGITLIALVVTIIVLLILASVAISLTIGQNGIFTRAQNATNKYEEASKNEQGEMQNVANFIDNLGRNDNGKIEASDLFEEEITVGSVVFWPNVEKYYPELLEKSILEYLNEKLATNFTNMTEMKVHLINMSGSPFQGMTPEQISLDDIVSKIFFDDSLTANDFFIKKLGFLFLIKSGEDRRQFVISYNRMVLTVLLNKKEYANYTNDQMLEYMIEQYPELNGKTPETITNDDLAHALNNDCNTMDEYWEYVKNDDSMRSSPILAQPAMMEILFKDLAISTDGIVEWKLGNVFYFTESQTCNFTLNNDKFTWNKKISINI